MPLRPIMETAPMCYLLSFIIVGTFAAAIFFK